MTKKSFECKSALRLELITATKMEVQDSDSRGTKKRRERCALSD